MRKILLPLFAFSLLFTAYHADAKGNAASSKTAPRATYRQSNAKASNYVINPESVIKGTPKSVDPGAAAMMKEFNSQYSKFQKKKDYDAVCSYIDKILNKPNKLDRDQKTLLYYYKADACCRIKDYDNALKTALTGFRLGGSNASKNIALAIRAAKSQKNLQLADKLIRDFEASKNYADANFYSIASEICFDRKRYAEAFEYLKKYGRQPRLSIYNKIQIFNGFGRYYRENKRYAEAIAQYSAIKELPKVDDKNKALADIEIAKCYLQTDKAKAIEIYKRLSTHKDGNIRRTSADALKRLTAKPKAPAKRKAPAKSGRR